MTERPGTMLLLVVAILTSACAESSPPTAPDDAPVLIDGELMSGGVGVLESSDFTEFELTAAVDPVDGGVVPNRWANFAVRVDGAEVDSWRPDGPRDRIAFRVPLGHSGEVTIEVTGDAVLDAGLAARRVGLVATYNYNHGCTDLFITDPESGSAAYPGDAVYLRSDLVSFPTRCYRRTSPDEERIVETGQAVLVPQQDGSLRFIPGASDTYLFGDEPDRRTWLALAGSTFVEGEVLLERSAHADSGPDVWRVRSASDLEFVAPVSCPDLPTVMFTLAELAPGLCLTFDRTGAVRRNGELVFQYEKQFCCAWPSLRFVVSSDGKAVLAGFHEAQNHFPLTWLTPSSMAVFGSDGQLLYEVDGYEQIHAVAFNRAGSELLVIGLAGGSSEATLVIDRRDAADGSLIRRGDDPEFEVGRVGDVRVLGARFVGDELWVAWRPTDYDPTRRVAAALAVVEPSSLEVVRSIAVPADPVFGYGTNVESYPGAQIVPDPSGRRATIVSRYDGLDGVVGFTIDVYQGS